MFCEKCGAKNDSSSKFCEKCGNKLETVEKETKTKETVKKNATSAKDKLNSFSKKQKIIGGVILGVVVVLIALYVVGSKMTSLETMGDKVFKELADKSTINNKYLSVPLDSKDYFISLGDTLKDTIEDHEINFDYNTYKVSTSKKAITVKYRDSEEDENYKVVFTVKKDGKSLLVFDKYVITKVTIEKDDGYSSLTLYDPDNVEKLTLTTVKGSKITVDDKEISESNLNKKKSDDEKDVYEIKGVATGNYDVKFTLGKLTFKKTIYVYSNEKNENDLTNYISYSYIDNDGKEYAKVFKTYITTYYEYVNDLSKTVEDFDKKYKTTEEIKETFADSKEYVEQVGSFKIDDVTIRSLYYYNSDDELTVTYRVNYTYKLKDSDSERTSYSTVKATYDLSNTELPKSLDYMPY